MSVDVVRVVKWVLFIFALGWAAYVSYGLWVISQIFPDQKPAEPRVSEAIIVCAGVLVPLVFTIILLLIRWPKKNRKMGSE